MNNTYIIYVYNMICVRAWGAPGRPRETARQSFWHEKGHGGAGETADDEAEVAGYARDREI